MFYTLTSQFLLKNSGGDKDFLYVFLIGSAMYIAIHWYLHMNEMDGFLGKIKEYLYYLLVVDLVACYTLFKLTPVNVQKENEQQITELTVEEKRTILQKMQEAKRMQQLRQKELEAEECNKNGKCTIFKSKESDDESLNKKNTKKESSESSLSKKKTKKEASDVSLNKKNTKNETSDVSISKVLIKKELLDTDTEIPVFVPKATK